MNMWSLRSSISFESLREPEDRQRANVLIYTLQVSQGHYLELHEKPRVTERTSQILYAFRIKMKGFLPLFFPYGSKKFFSLPNCFQVQCTMDWYQRSLMQQPEFQEEFQNYHGLCLNITSPRLQKLLLSLWAPCHQNLLRQLILKWHFIIF